jgi:hypothetical protein
MAQIVNHVSLRRTAGSSTSCQRVKPRRPPRLYGVHTTGEDCRLSQARRKLQARPLPGEAEVLSADGESIGGLILFADDDGYLRSLEIYTWEEPAPLPAPHLIRPYVNLGTD